MEEEEGKEGGTMKRRRRIRRVEFVVMRKQSWASRQYGPEETAPVKRRNRAVVASGCPLCVGMVAPKARRARSRCTATGLEEYEREEEEEGGGGRWSRCKEGRGVSCRGAGLDAEGGLGEGER
jgi:hypothetical protein